VTTGDGWRPVPEALEADPAVTTVENGTELVQLLQQTSCAPFRRSTG
jgi:hypothetical protein